MEESVAGQLAHVIGPLKCYNDDYQYYDYQCYPRFTLITACYPLIHVLLSYPCFTSRPSVHLSRHPSVRIRVLPLPENKVLWILYATYCICDDSHTRTNIGNCQFFLAARRLGFQQKYSLHKTLTTAPLYTSK